MNERCTVAVALLIAVLASACHTMDGAAVHTVHMDIDHRLEREIVELHQFFERWFNGSIENSDTAFARFVNVLDETFVIVSPDASVHSRGDILATVRNGYGSASRAQPMRIWIENVTVRQVSQNHIIATYEEWQQQGDSNPRGRVSTGVFRTTDNTPNGLLWLHVHETWMQTK